MSKQSAFEKRGSISFQTIALKILSGFVITVQAHRSSVRCNFVVAVPALYRFGRLVF